MDLGCGTGELTRALHQSTGAHETVGVESSAAMLAKAPPSEGGLRFVLADMAHFEPPEQLDLVFSNAALHWLPDHAALFERLRAMLRPRGQLAVQVPANHDHPSHALAREVAGEEPFASALAACGSGPQPPYVLPPEQYATLLHRLGFEDPHVRLQVYLHELPEPAAVVEWTRGTTLTPYQRSLGEELFRRFLARYRERLLSALPDQRPFPYPFKRILLWGRLR